MIKAPAFWFEKKSWWPILLWPLAMLYQLGHRIRWWTKRPTPSPIPLICGEYRHGRRGQNSHGSFHWEMLTSMGHTYRFLTRGYGGKEQGPIIVNPAYHSRASGG